RYALGYFLGALLGLFYRLGILESQEQSLKRLASFLETQKAFLEKQGQALADFFYKKTPLIYGAESIQSALKIFKIKINENAKTQAFYNVFPELNHNEMIGLSQTLYPTALLLLENKHAHPQVKKRLQVFQALIEEKKLAHLEIKKLSLPGESLIEELFSAVLLGDYTSYYLAQKYKVDPVPVMMVEEFKNRMGK
ncbi:MAG: hypothetical protein KDK66_08375, partial [Deltaproteobacteria bacterium]|nr:hypothetical protein [Deltaproteobacteria bacterium]